MESNLISMDSLITKAVDEEKLVILSQNNFSITDKAFIDDDVELLQYLLNNKVLLAQHPKHLRELAVKFGSINILKMLRDEGLLEEASLVTQKDWFICTAAANLIIKQALDTGKLSIAQNISPRINQDTFIITAKVFEDDDIELLIYLLGKQLLFSQNYDDLIKLAIKKGSIDILNFFYEKKLFEHLSLEKQKEWLLKAIKSNVIDVVTLFLHTAQFSINKLDIDFLSAAKTNDMFSFLLGAGFRLGSSTMDVASLFSYACKYNKPTVLNILIKKDALLAKDDSELKEHFDSLIDKAIQYGNVQALEILKEHHYFDDCTKARILIYLRQSCRYKQRACARFFSKSVNEMIHHEKSSNSKPVNCNAKEKAPLNQFSLPRTLKRSTSVFFNFTNNNSKPELYRSERHAPKDGKGSLALKKLIIEETYDINAIKAILQSGVDPDTKYMDNTTLLMYAAQKGYVEIVKEFLKYHADRTKQDDFGRNSLMIAIEQGHCKIVAALLDYENNIYKKTADHKKTQVTQKDRKGNTPLIYAATNFCPDCIKLLLNAKADILTPNKKGETISSIFENPEYHIYNKFESYCKKKFVYLAALKSDDPYHKIAMPLYNLLNAKLCILDDSENPLQDLLRALSFESELTENKNEKQLCQKAIELSKKFIEKAYKDISQCKDELLKHELPNKNKYSDLIKYANIKISSLTS